MKITVAKSAGYCFGVSRAVNIVEELLDKGEKVCTLGPIIHNPQKVREFEARGVKTAETPEQADKNSILVIRAHGIPSQTEEKIKSLGLKYENATCPFVIKIHNIVLQHSKICDIILIAGDKSHPEVQGILGHCSSECHIFLNSDELDELLEKFPYIKEKSVCVVAQTTFDMTEWKKCLSKVKKLCTNAKIYDTICNATSVRQSEAEILASQSDLMLVIGGRHSSNTNKLFNICKSRCAETYLIETADELPVSAIKKSCSIGVTAGASTPASIIKEVLKTMSEEIKEKKVEEGEENFKELLEESLKTYNTDGRVKGIVVGITPTEVRVDVGRKQTGIVPLSELSSDPNAKTEDLVKIGDELDL